MLSYEKRYRLSAAPWLDFAARGRTSRRSRSRVSVSGPGFDFARSRVGSLRPAVSLAVGAVSSRAKQSCTSCRSRCATSPNRRMPDGKTRRPIASLCAHVGFVNVRVALSSARPIERSISDRRRREVMESLLSRGTVRRIPLHRTTQMADTQVNLDIRRRALESIAKIDSSIRRDFAISTLCHATHKTLYTMRKKLCSC